MEDIRTNSVTCFDTLYTTRHISMFKVLLHFLAPSMQNKLAVYIKFMELQYTMQFSNSIASSASMNAESSFDFEQVCDEIMPYCESQEKQKILQMRNLFQTIHNLQNMMEMMETMKELFPESMGTDEGQNGLNPEMLAAMSSMFGGCNMDLSDLANIFPSG